MKTEQTNAKTENAMDRKVPERKTEITLEFPLLDIASMEQSEKEEPTDCSKKSK